jgi:cytidylate kinase
VIYVTFIRTCLQKIELFMKIETNMVLVSGAIGAGQDTLVNSLVDTGEFELVYLKGITIRQLAHLWDAGYKGKTIDDWGQFVRVVTTKTFGTDAKNASDEALGGFLDDYQRYSPEVSLLDWVVDANQIKRGAEAMANGRNGKKIKILASDLAVVLDTIGDKIKEHKPDLLSDDDLLWLTSQSLCQITLTINKKEAVRRVALREGIIQRQAKELVENRYEKDQRIAQTYGITKKEYTSEERLVINTTQLSPNEVRLLALIEINNRFPDKSNKIMPLLESLYSQIMDETNTTMTDFERRIVKASPNLRSGIVELINQMDEGDQEIGSLPIDLVTSDESLRVAA